MTQKQHFENFPKKIKENQQKVIDVLPIMLYIL
jgi:hypothetical protein